MSPGSRLRGLAVLIAGVALLSACTGGAGEAGSSSPSPTPLSPSMSSQPPASPSPSASPTTPPPLAPGTSLGRLLVVQQAEDASLVSGEQPIRLTLARTGNIATWITAPPQKLSGLMTTEQALLTLGWRPADDGTTSALPNPRPNGLLSFEGGSLAFTMQRANVRADGTLVIDIRPISAAPETVESYGPVTLTLDGAPGVLELGAAVGELTVRILVTGDDNQQAVVQVADAAGGILESGFVSPERPVIDSWIDVASGDTTWSDPVVTLTPPQRSKPGTVRITGSLTVAGTTTELDQVIARWSRPLTP